MIRELGRLAAALFLLLGGARAAAQSAPGTPTEEPMRLATATGEIHGTLLLPAGGGPVPVALLIAGSGPTDRDGNSAGLPGKNDSLKLLAQGLAAGGVATVRFDKRGVGASAAAAPRESDLRFDAYVEDAAAWIRALRADPRFAGVSVVGHSEGSLIGMMAAQRGEAAAFVSVAGVGRPASHILRDQLRPRLPPALRDESERVLSALEAGRTADSVPPPLAALFRPGVQPYLISWFRVDPAGEIARLEIPVLIAQGTTDAQVAVQEARTLRAARPDAELLLVEGMNHVLKTVPPDPARQQASYMDPALPVSSELVEGIATFLRRVHGGTGRE